jgi:site-specific DNA-methyltransferase (adenine-specific)
MLPEETQFSPGQDNTAEGLASLRQANQVFRRNRWPKPFDTTNHRLRLGDARDLSWIPNDSIHLVVTSPPYWVLKEYQSSPGQMGEIQNYEEFLLELDKVWAETARVLVPGGRICCVVGDVCLPRKKSGRHYIMPLHADIQVRSRRLGLDCLTPILWHKISNGATEVQGNGAGFYGKPYQPGAVIKNDFEHILFLRKPGGYRSVTPIQKALSMLTSLEMKAWFRPYWSDIKGASTRSGHPAPYPLELPERLIRMFSFAGDTILDPFVGTGTTSMAAANSGRNSIGVDVQKAYLRMADKRFREFTSVQRLFGAPFANIQREKF